MNQDSNTKIKSFWKWFVENEIRIREVLDSDLQTEREALVNDMDNQILDFGLFTWEVGHGTEKSFFLTISPNGNRERLLLSRSIVKDAPDLSDWEFYYAKPAKDWDLQFSLFDNNVVEQQVNAGGWSFALFKQPDHQIKIIVEADNIPHLDFDTRLTAADLVVTSILGEELKIMSVGDIEIVNKFDSTYSSSSAILSLKERFEALLK
jgi:hypothetical protein